MSESKIAGFKIKKITDLNEAVAGRTDGFLPESDLTIQHEKHIIQFDYQKADEQKRETIAPGSYNLINTSFGVGTVKLQFRTRNLLTSVISTSKILNEANTFFNKLDVYERLGRPKKRGVLLYSIPGLGKSSAISHFCLSMMTEDPGTVVLNWPTDQVRASEACQFLSAFTEYTPECTKLVLIIEDIGGGEKDFDGDRSVSASLLNMLDGVDFVFKLPTFIVATTNFPANLLSTLADRPGRFDLMLELKPPAPQERIELMKFLAKRDLTEEEEYAITSKQADNFSIAHLEEVVVRSMLHDKSFADVIEELFEHSKRYKNAFNAPKKSSGFSLDD